MMATVRVRHQVLIATIRDALAKAGVAEPICSIEAEVMAEADLLGVPSHGIRMLPLLLRALRDGRAKPDPQVRMLRDRAAVGLMDGDYGPGRYLSVQAMQQAVQRAKQFGIGACMAIRVTHWGRAHAYAYRAAQAGCVGICTTNAIPNMLAWNSGSPLLGNNPLAIGIPRSSHQDPVVLDMAMSQAAVGKIGTAAREGRQVPGNWGLDADGNPTQDPAAILSSRKLLSFGEHKGAGLALMMELLTGALSGGLFSHEIAQADSSGLDPDSSKLFMALEVESFVAPDRLAERITDYLTYLSAAEPGLPISFPGERGWQTRDRNLAEGIPIHGRIVEQLQAVDVELQDEPA